MVDALDDIFIQFYEKTKMSKSTNPRKWNKSQVKVWCDWIGEEFKINTRKVLMKGYDGEQLDGQVKLKNSKDESKFLDLWEPFEGDVCLSSWQFLKKTWEKDSKVKAPGK